MFLVFPIYLLILPPEENCLVLKEEKLRETKEKIRNNQITYLSDEKLIQKVIFKLDQNIHKDKKNWKQLLFDVIREWKLSNEKFSTNQICYLICGEAFNWKTLAIRLASQSKNLFVPKF